MGVNGSKENGEYSLLLKDFTVTRKVDQEGLLFMKNTKNGGEYLLRQFTFNQNKEYENTCKLLQKRKEQLANCKFLVPLEKIIAKTEDQYCATFYKMYALFQFTDRTLQNQINQRQNKKKRFQETELWSILASCILGLSHLQRNQIRHQSLRSNSILISREGLVKIYDPIATGCQTNYQTLASRRSTPHIYLSPELTDGLHLQSNNPSNSPYKSDIFTLGIILLQAGLLQYQDQCYRDDCSRIHWETVQYHIHRFKQDYSEDLTAFLQLMLAKQERLRPDWIQLQKKVMKQQETKTVSLLNLPYPKSSRSSQQIQQINKYQRISNPPQNLIKSQTSNSQNPNFQRHTHLYHQKTNSQNYSQNYPIQSTISVQPRIVCISVSKIDFTRPQRSIFPNNSYVTSTKIDENLIIVTQQQKISEADTPNDRNNSSYFQSSSKNITDRNNYQIYQNTYNGNIYTPHNQQVIRQITPIVNTYGLSNNQTDKISNFNPKPGSSHPSTNKSQPKQSQIGQFIIERYKQGSEYKGYKLDGMRHGFGTFYYQDGGMYEGQWRNNKMQGKGKLFYQSGKLAYQGEWYNDQFSGKGILYNQYPDVLREPINYNNLDDIDQFWTKYEGSFREDLKSGRGILFLSNGEYYDGEFQQDMANGKGTFYRMNGQLIVGRWQNNIYKN